MEMCEQKILNMFAYMHVVSPKAITPRSSFLSVSPVYSTVDCCTHMFR